MNISQIDFQYANQYIPWIFLVGLALGIGGYALGFWPTIGQGLVQHLIISFAMAYPIIVIVTNFNFQRAEEFTFGTYLLFGLSFIIVGLLATEVELIVKTFLFDQGTYLPFRLGGGHLFNAIMSLILGFGFRHLLQLKYAATSIDKSKIPVSELGNLKSIPVKQGSSTIMKDLDKIIYFEAYDNYSFLFDSSGAKQICNYSLKVLEEKLNGDFLRVHRKYLVNKNRIQKITPHLKGRFLIEFDDNNKSSIISSNSHAEAIKILTSL